MSPKLLSLLQSFFYIENKGGKELGGIIANVLKKTGLTKQKNEITYLST